MARRVRLPIQSRYLATPLFQLTNEKGELQNVYCWGTWNPIDFPPADDDVLHVVRQSDIGRLDLIADRIYRDVNLWWVIAHVNDILDPFTVETGRILRIPSRQNVVSTLVRRGEPPRSIEIPQVPFRIPSIVR